MGERSRRYLTPVWFLFLFGVVQAAQHLYYSVCDNVSNDTSVYDYKVLNLEGTQNVSMGNGNRGNAMLLLNVATFGEFTPQYYQLNKLVNTYKGKSVSIVGFPCDQFAHQEPGANKTELLAGLRYVRPGRNYTPDFTLHMKIHVNGKDEQPLYRYLKDSCPAPLDTTYDRSESFWDPIKVNDISWNFEKFLIDHNGRPLFRFKSGVEPTDLDELIDLTMNRTLDSAEWQAKAEIKLQTIHNKMKAREGKKEEEKKK